MNANRIGSNAQRSNAQHMHPIALWKNNQNFVPVCHYCSSVRHIRPKCQFLDKNNQPNFYENTKGPMYVLHEWITQLTSVVSKLE